MANNQANLSVPVVGISDLGISATADGDTVYAGQDLTYTLLISNLGPDDDADAS